MLQDVLVLEQMVSEMIEGVEELKGIYGFPPKNGSSFPLTSPHGHQYPHQHQQQQQQHHQMNHPFTFHRDVSSHMDRFMSQTAPAASAVVVAAASGGEESEHSVGAGNSGSDARPLGQSDSEDVGYRRRKRKVRKILWMFVYRLSKNQPKKKKEKKRI
jgi:hypothetical protein